MHRGAVRMGSLGVRRALVLISLVFAGQFHATETKRPSRSIHVPIVRGLPSDRGRRAVNTGSIGLGDFQDISYNVLIHVGGTDMPVVLDTGSADLWVLSTSCRGETCASNQAPFYPLTTFRPADLDATLTYGDSRTGTYAQGPIGSDFVSLAGLSVQAQYFAAINATNTSVVQTGSVGIFGLGFPSNSLFWMDMFLRQNGSTSGMVRRDAPPAALDDHARLPDRLQNLVARWFPKNGLADDEGSSVAHSEGQPATTAALQSSIVNYGPFIPRLVAQGLLESPMFSITLQRDTIEIGGNEGMLSIGALPPSVLSESLTWVDVRGYLPSQGGLDPPSDAPGEVYPVTWEIPLDDVWFDGAKLKRSTMSPPNLSLSALIDTGNSLIRGPPDVVSQIFSLLGGSQIACSPPHTLEFQIGGKLFPVDPRDLVSEVRSGDPDLCTVNVVSTDVPVADGSGYLFSWNLGDPFLKGVLAAFHYGSLTRPSQNPPRVGLLSTVGHDAGKKLCDDKHRAEQERQGYPMIVERPPASLPPSRGTGIGGVPLAARPTATQSGISEALTNGVSGDVRIGVSIWAIALVAFLTCVTWRITG